MHGAIPRCGFIVLMALAGCAGNPPYHTPPQSDAAPNAQCVNAYIQFDNAIDPRQMPGVAGPSQTETCAFSDANNRDGDKMADCLKKVQDKTLTENAACWNTSWEQHKTYDLFFTEFDDEGWAADVRAKMDMDKPAPAQGQPSWMSEQDVLFQHLNALVNAHPRVPLDIVIYTHGWHGSAESDSYYVVLFRAFLKSLALLDESSHTHRHVVGIYVSWRGDSILLPNKIFSVWDRKQAAETVSAGAVHGLFARLNNFYIENSCRVTFDDAAASSTQPSKASNPRLIGDTHRCGSVRMSRSIRPLNGPADALSRPRQTD